MRLTLLATLLFATTAHGQWLPDQATDRALWERTGVPLEGMQFYRVPRVSQRLSIIDSVHVNGIYAADYKGPMIDTPNPNGKQLWREPGGLHWAPKDQWRNATAAFFPSPVEVYRTSTKVLNSFGYQQDNSVVRWRFPDGTVFADLLIARRDGGEVPFEVRIRRKLNGKWDSEAYRPFDESNAPAGTIKKRFKSAGIHDAVDALEFDALVLPESTPPHAGRFVRSSVPLAGGFLPRDYAGPVARCASCHNRAGESGAYAGVNAPGNDSVISWQPFTTRTLNSDLPPEIDNRWARAK